MLYATWLWELIAGGDLSVLSLTMIVQEKIERKTCSDSVVSTVPADGLEPPGARPSAGTAMGPLCVSLCQSIKIKPTNMCMFIYILVESYVYIIYHNFLYHFSTLRQHIWLKPVFVEGKDLFIMCSQCWWPGNARGQGISSHVIDLLSRNIITLAPVGLTPLQEYSTKISWIPRNLSVY